MRCRYLVLFAGSLASGAVFANNGDQMVGYSGISNAMGGAVVATPQDVTTSLSNPAGLAFLELGDAGTRFDMNVAVLNPNRSLNGVESDSSAYVLATGGFAFQSTLLGDDFYIGVGAYPISGGGVDFPAQAFKTPGKGTPAAIVSTRTSLRIGPSIAYKVRDNLAVGANLSLAANQMSLKNIKASTNFPSDVAYGASFALGVTYQINNRTRFGATYTSRSYSEDLEWNMDDGKWRLSFEDPQTVALGLSYQPTDALQLEADLKWLNYSRVRSQNTLHGPIPAKDQVLAFGWDDQYVIALGARYRMSDKLSLMAGYNYGKSPLDEADINNNTGVTAIVEQHLSAGLSARITKYSELTLSLIHGFKKDMTASSLLPGATSPTTVSFETNLATLQFTYRH